MTAGGLVSPIEEVRTDLSDGVLTITLNRPEVRNAVTQDMMGALGGILAAADVSDDVGAVVLTGAGGAFCAGGDVKNMVARNADPKSVDPLVRMNQQRHDHRAVSARLHNLTKPTIASIPGPAAGAGFSLSLACDLRIAADTAVMTSAFAKVGLSGDYGGTWYLTQLVGPAKAREIYLLADRIDMAEASRIGIVNWVVKPEALAGKTRELALRLANGPRVAHRFIKENINRAIGHGLLECLDMESVNLATARQTEDHKEAAKAFAEKRPPRFKGR